MATSADNLAMTGNNTPIPETTRKRAVEAYLKGMKTDKILEDLTISRSSLYSILRENGLEPSRTGANLPSEVTRLLAEVERLQADLDRERKSNERLTKLLEKALGS